MLADAIDALDGDEMLTTGEAARLLGVSRQHIVDLADRGDLAATFVGSHRRIRRGDLPDVDRPRRATRDQDRSRWLGVATAAAFLRNPASARASAQRFLRGAAGNRWHDEWERLLEGPALGVVDALTSDSLRSRELRQNSPFVGVLTDDERAAVLASFAEERRR